MEARVIPPAALRDEDAVELARVWIAECGLHCSLKVGMYAADGGMSQETRAWGMILADMAGHIADALSGQGMADRNELFQAIVDRFDEETSRPTSTRTGSVPPKVA